jgi:hypothetical protein
VDVALNSLNITTEDVHFVGLHVLFDAIGLAGLLDLLKVLFLVDVGHVTRVKDVVDIFEHLFVDDLSIHEKETDGFVVHTRLHQTLLDVFAPGSHVVVFDHLDLEDLIVHNERSHFAQGLTARTTYSQN